MTDWIEKYEQDDLFNPRTYVGLSPEKKKEAFRLRDRLFKLLYYSGPTEIGCKTSNLREELSQREYRAYNEVFYSFNELGLYHGFELHCDSNTLYFKGGTGAIKFYLDENDVLGLPRGVIFQDEFIIRNNDAKWIVEKINGYDTYIEFNNEIAAAEYIINEYKRIGSIPLLSGLALLKGAGIWETHAFNPLNGNFIVVRGGIRYSYEAQNLLIEHEFDIEQHSTTDFKLTLLNGESIDLSFPSIDMAAQYVIDHYLKLNILD